MSPAPQPIPSAGQLVSILKRYPSRWLVPAAAVTIVATLYALLRPATWEASQALIVRNEAAHSEQGPGKFNHTDQMKTVQETILELVKSRQVLADALGEAGPPAHRKQDGEAWPTARDVVKARKTVELSPPNGAEFGKTEVFYLKVEDHDRDRAVALTTAIFDGLRARFQQLLDDRAASMIRELQKAVDLAAVDLDESTGKLAELEGSVGSDLAELRILHESPAGNSDLRQKVVELDNELRQARTDRRAKAELLSLLRSARSDPSRPPALPNRLLESHASLRQLIDGLSAARLVTCDMLGRMSPEHPLVRAALAEEDQIVRKVNDEWVRTTEIAETELRLADQRVESLEGQLADVRARFDRLAGLRADYANLVAQTQSRTFLLETAERTLADARASQAAARAASLIDCIDQPDAGIYPVGLRRSMIILFGLIGGLLLGTGVLFLTVPTPQPAEAEAQETPLPQAPPRSSNGKSARPAPLAHPFRIPTDLVPQPGHSLTFAQALARTTYASGV
jgi:succinoglycan biosynthesis transport protein ExoP